MKISFLEQSFGRKREEQCLCEDSLPHGAAGASPAPQQHIHIPVEKLCLTQYFPQPLESKILTARQFNFNYE